MTDPKQETTRPPELAWAVYATDGLPHVAPLRDLRPHDMTKGCWCHPIEDAGVMVHHSMDRREEFELGRKAS